MTLFNDWSDYPGIYGKFLVFRTDTYEVVDDSFTLRPEVDPHARLAMLVYAGSVQAQNPQLADEIRMWIRSIEEGMPLERDVDDGDEDF